MRPGSHVTARTLTDVLDRPVTVPDRERVIHLQFRRFAGCPVCNLHLRSVARRHGEIEAAGVREVAVFHSPAGELRQYAADLPFTVIADPGKQLYREFGVESAPRALLDPRAWGPVLHGVVRSAWTVLRGHERLPARRQSGGRLGLPADLLIDGDARVLAAKYGEHAYDQWSVDELLHLMSEAQRPPRPAPSGQSAPASAPAPAADPTR